MKVPVRVPCRAGSASNSGACSTVKFGSKPARSATSGRMNMFRTNAMCHALGDTYRTESRYFGSAPQYRSCTNRSGRPSRYSRTSPSSASKCSAEIGWLTLPQSTSRSVDGSRTMNLSFGERPVCGAVTATNGPMSASSPSPRRMADSSRTVCTRLG